MICDRRVAAKLKTKLYKAVVRPVLTYGLEAAPVKRKEEIKMDLAEMKMLRRSVGITRRDRIRRA